MKKILLVLSLLIVSNSAISKIKVFTCEPEWTSLVEEITKNRAVVYQAISGKQDPHKIQARPSLISKVRNSDMLVCSGAELEIGWLPLLVQKAGNNKVKPGSIGYFEVATVIDVLDKKSNVDRSMGDQHPLGNPHLHLNPYNILIAGEEVVKRLSNIDQANSKFYQENFNSFKAKFSSKIEEWENRTKVLKGKNIISHHADINYLVQWLNLNLLATIENKPGIPPSATQMKKLVYDFEGTDVLAINAFIMNPSKPAKWLSERLQAPNVMLHYTVGSHKNIKNLFDLFEENVSILLDINNV